MNSNDHVAEIRRGIAQALEALNVQTGRGSVASMEINGCVFGPMTPHDGPSKSDGELTTLLDHYGGELATLRVWFDVERQCICTESKVLKPIDYNSLS